ncbi:tetratricopeptide repeat protein [Abyssalbus ytuae]|uniref:Tetratricopeptide repeat protein n=1 Tax=Abyssalbus ytuae TaxID=2926907 RepID=A0A9E6ZXV9_9FLAO|nr:tetratricopeptide repeat protein [Abyssalbus ytuae]UOB18931.1 tetratricopeptide repeat protein [Abyssalbus ytuae]
MRKTLKTFIAILISQVGFSQDYQSEFLKYCQTNDTINQLKILTEWKKANPKDAELYTSFFNYYFAKSRREIVQLTSTPPNGEGLELKDSLNQTAGYIGSQIHFDQNEVNKGLEKINQGIELYPNRLDMRFGKIYVLGQLEDWNSFTSEIIRSIQYSSKNNNNWTWINNEKQENGKEFFLSSLQDYQLQLYNTGNDDLLVNMRNIANEILKYYPNHIESLSNLSITYLLTGEYDKGLEPLLKAEKLNPRDYIILSNIAQAYKLKGDTKKAIEYYKKTIEFGDDQAKEYAKQQITELKN